MNTSIRLLRGVPMPYYPPYVAPGMDQPTAAKAAKTVNAQVLSTDTSKTIVVTPETSDWVHGGMEVVSDWLRVLRPGLYNLQAVLNHFSGDSGTFTTFSSATRVISLLYRLVGSGLGGTEVYVSDSIPQATVTGPSGVIYLPSSCELDQLFEIYVGPECFAHEAPLYEFKVTGRVALAGTRIFLDPQYYDLTMYTKLAASFAFVSSIDGALFGVTNSRAPVIVNPLMHDGPFVCGPEVQCTHRTPCAVMRGVPASPRK